MANKDNNGGDKKPQLKVTDLQTKKDPQGGRKAGKGQMEFNKIKSDSPGL